MMKTNIPDSLSNRWQEVKLGEIANYSDTRIKCADLSVENYVGTDNIRQNKQGKENSQYVPEKGYTTEYRQNDILIANIRPYLKKIWYATNNGGSSADVLTVRVFDKNVDPKFVYYNLFQDVFFDYAMRGAKGSKMPRGDKNQILGFPIFVPDFPTQLSIARTLSLLDDKIELNKQINDNLEAMAKEYYKYYFTRKYSTLKMTYVEDIAVLRAGGDKPNTFSLYKTNECNIPIYSNGIEKDGLYGYTNKAEITERSLTISARGTIGCGIIRLQPFVPIIRLIVAIPHVIGGDLYLKFVLERMNFNKSGSVQQQLTIPQLSKLLIPYPPENELEDFGEITTPLLNLIYQNTQESAELAKLRDFLLPKLMNGEVSI